MNTTNKNIAKQRICTLFFLAQKTFRTDASLAQHYIDLALRIVMAAKVRLPLKYRRQVCRRCKSFILPGVNSRVRIKQRRQSHVSIKCLRCGERMRIPMNSKKRKTKL
jgi:ribonuclease P protein subunit RPR2